MSPAVPKPKSRPKKAPKQRARAAIRRKGRSRFPEQRQPDYKAWIVTLPCALRGRLANELSLHHCEGDVEAAHVRTRGAGAGDYANLTPLCHRAHAVQHQIGIRTWAAIWFGSLDELKRVAAFYGGQWERQKALGWTVEDA